MSQEAKHGITPCPFCLEDEFGPIRELTRDQASGHSFCQIHGVITYQQIVDEFAAKKDIVNRALDSQRRLNDSRRGAQA